MGITNKICIEVCQIFNVIIPNSTQVGSWKQERSCGTSESFEERIERKL